MKRPSKRKSRAGKQHAYRTRQRLIDGFALAPGVVLRDDIPPDAPPGTVVAWLGDGTPVLLSDEEDAR